MIPEQDPVVTIVVVNWNGRVATLRCLQSLLRLDYPTARIVVCDNGSTDGSVEAISVFARERGISLRVGRPNLVPSDASERLVVIEIGENLGYAGGNNVGIRHALAGGAQWVWILNNDTEVEPDALRHLLDTARRTGASIVGPTLVVAGDPSRAQALGGATYAKWTARPHQIGAVRWKEIVLDEARVARRFAYVSGAAALVSRAFLDDVGLLDESYFLYFEELEWMARARGRHRMAWARRAIVHHEEGGTTGTASVTSEYYYARARMLFTRRHHPEAVPTVAFTLGTRALGFAARGKATLAKTVVQATWDGLRGRGGRR